MRFFVFFFFLLISSFSNSQLVLTSIPESGMNEPDKIDLCPCDSVQLALSGDISNVESIEWKVDQETSSIGMQTSFVQGFCQWGNHTIQVIVTNNDNSTTELNAFIRVSTPPQFDPLLQIQNYICMGENIVFPGGYIDSSNYFGFEMTPSGIANEIQQTNVEQGNIPDNDPSCFHDTLHLNLGNQLISSSNEIAELMINLNHTYMGDLIITYTCPNGNSVITHQQGGGSTNLGTDLQGFDYSWTTDANLDTWVQAANGEDLPAGEYQSIENFDNFIGCPVSGDWTLEVCDVFNNDLGTVFNWGVHFDLQDSANFTPYPTNAYWLDSPWISASTDSSIVVTQEITNDIYNLVVEDNFGCSYTQEVALTVNEPIDLNLVDQVNLYCSYEQLAIDESAIENCSGINGTYTYCYVNLEDQNWLICPDDSAEDVMMSVTFDSGFLEINYDYIYIYDGSTTDAPLIETLNGNLEGLSFTATNDSGCLLINLVTDYSINCEVSGFDPISYTVSCGNAANYTWSWEPAELLVNANSPTLTIAEVTNDVMVFTATITDPNAPGCNLTHDVVVFTDQMNDIGDDGEAFLCIGDQNVSLFNYLNGNPSGEGIWFDENNEPASGFFNADELGQYSFYYSFENCDASSVVTVEVASVPESPNIIVDGNFLITDVFNAYQWYLDGVLLEGATNQSYTAPVDGTYFVEVFNSSGCSAISEEVIIGPNTDNINDYQNINLALFPNPFSESTKVMFANQSANYLISLYDGLGNMVRKYNDVSGSLIIDKGDLAPGVYLLQIVDKDSGISRKQQLLVE